jgi:hypothetical protein
MVRSKSEASGREFFGLVEQIRQEAKYFHVSRSELAAKLAMDKQCEILCEHETTDVDGSTVFVTLRLNWAQRFLGRWSVSLKLHKVRVDGIDWLRLYDTPNGTKCSGWHRHGWDATTKQADLHIPLPDAFGVDVNTTEDFILRICSEMQIYLSAKDVGIFDDDLLGA